MQGYRRITSIVVLVLPQLLSWVGHPVAGADLQPLVDGISAVVAAGLNIWSKLKPDAPKP